MDRFDKYITTGKCNLYSSPTFGNGGYSYRNSFSNPYVVDISFDRFMSCINYRKFKDIPNNIHFNIYDEGIVKTREECMLRLQFLKYLNSFKNASFSFNLSDSSLPAYIAFMNSISWVHGNDTSIRLMLDRMPNKSKTHIPLEEARAVRIDIREEQLLWFSDKTIRLVTPKLREAEASNNAFILKKFIDSYADLVDSKYKSSLMDDYEKVYLAYHFLFDDKKGRNIDLEPLNITYADERTYHDSLGIQRLNPSPTKWESRPAGTLRHRRGVCSGQARLFNSLICNPYNKIAAEATTGVIPSGELHCWSSFVINDHLYQCCTTIEGLYKDLDCAGYIPDNDQTFQKAYDHYHFPDEKMNKMKRHLRSIKR